MDAEQAPTYADVGAALERLSSPLGAAGCHGLLCGYLSASPAARVEDWLAEVMPEPEPGDLLAAEGRGVLERLFADARAHMASPDLEFSPLLPADRAPIMERGRALADWCDGFLSGLGLGGYRPDAGAAEQQEFLADVEEITKLGVAEEGDEGEQALAELIEYVRVGVLLVSRMPVATGGGDDTLH